MKKILILVNTMKDSYQQLVDAGTRVAASVDVKTVDDISIFADHHTHSIWADGIPLETYDVVYFRAMIRNPELVATMTTYLRAHQRHVVDEVLEKSTFAEGKIVSYLKLSQAQLPIIPTFYLHRKNLTALTLPYPWIIKLSDSSQGKDVFLSHSAEESARIFSQYNHHLLVQPFIPNDGDLRVLVIGTKVIGAIKRTAPTGEYRNNVSLGGNTHVFPVTPEIEEIALRAVGLLGYSIAGVDLVFNEATHAWLIMEVNRAPQYTGFIETTGIDVPQEIMAFLTTSHD